MKYVGSKNRLAKDIVLISEYSMPDDFECVSGKKH
jgi:hypothetical protein